MCAIGAIRRRRAGRARRHLRSVWPDRAPRRHALLVVDYWRWLRMERRVTTRYRRVVVMSDKDAKLLGPRAPAVVIENGVDLERFRAEPERPGQHLLFIGSFRHFPDVAAYRFSPSTSGHSCATNSPRCDLPWSAVPTAYPTGALRPACPSPLSMNASVCWASSPMCAPSM